MAASGRSLEASSKYTHSALPERHSLLRRAILVFSRAAPGPDRAFIKCRVGCAAKNSEIRFSLSSRIGFSGYDGSWPELLLHPPTYPPLIGFVRPITKNARHQALSLLNAKGRDACVPVSSTDRQIGAALKVGGCVGRLAARGGFAHSPADPIDAQTNGKRKRQTLCGKRDTS